MWAVYVANASRVAKCTLSSLPFVPDCLTPLNVSAPKPNPAPASFSFLNAKMIHEHKLALAGALAVTAALVLFFFFVFFCCWFFFPGRLLAKRMDLHLFSRPRV